MSDERLEQERGDTTGLPVPLRVVTGRDATGRSVFRSAAVTPQVIAFDALPGFVFYETYATDDVPGLTGDEPDPVARQRRAFPVAGGSLFRLVAFPATPAGDVAGLDGYHALLDELARKIPGIDQHFERATPGMHTSESVDYGIVIQGQITLELDEGRTMLLKPGDCVVQNGTRHRWVNASEAPCLMAFVLIGGRRL